jgi:hypothetical protein
MWYQRLRNLVIPEIRRDWEARLKDLGMAQDPERYILIRPGMEDDVNLKDPETGERLTGWQLEAMCGICGQTFVPSSDSFMGLNHHGEGLYEHYQKVVEMQYGDVGGTEIVDCRGLGIIEGAYKGLERRKIEEVTTPSWDRG